MCLKQPSFSNFNLELFLCKQVSTARSDIWVKNYYVVYEHFTDTFNNNIFVIFQMCQ